MRSTKDHIILAIKGAVMGAANVIPGVSGGTIALITGIYEELINSLKSFDLKAINLLLSFKFKELCQYVNGSFLLAIFLGVVLSIFSLAKILVWLLTEHEILTMNFFFGLILASVWLVGKTIRQWHWQTIISFFIGVIAAVGVAFINPGQENASWWYLILCGVAAISSMLLPGLSGSFILLVMGNYLLVLGAIGNFDFNVLIPFAVGCLIGLIAFSNLLSWLFRNYKEITLALLTGFILGSLMIIWPWKETQYLTDKAGKLIYKEGNELIPAGYIWLAPEINTQFILGIGLMIIGFFSVWGLDKLGEEVKT